MTCICCGSPMRLAGSWWTCGECGHRVYDITPEDNKDYHRGYRNARHKPGDIKGERLDVMMYMKNRDEYRRKRVAAIEPWLPASGLMWDFGCGGGYMMEHYKARFAVVGTEVDPLSLQAMDDLHLPHTTGTPDGAQVVMAWHSLEHCSDVEAVMKRLVFAMAPRGVLIVEVPVERKYTGYIGHACEFSRESMSRFMARFPVEMLHTQEGIQSPAVLWIGRRPSDGMPAQSSLDCDGPVCDRGE